MLFSKSGLFFLGLVATVYFGMALASADKEAGKNKAVSCAACHGVDSNSTLMPVYPKLAGQSESYLKKQLKDFKNPESGRNDPVMGSMAAVLSEQDIADLSIYFASLTATSSVVPENFLGLGRKIYMGGDLQKGLSACSACHGPGGDGNKAAGFPAIRGQNVEYTQKQLKQFRDGARKNDLNGMMRGVASKMTDAEIEAVSHYIAGLQ